MKRRTHAAAALFAALSMSACAAQEGAGSETDDRNDDMGDARPLRILPVILDAATEQWAATEPSIHDGQPIGMPGPDRRYREVFGRLATELADGGSIATMYAFSFGADASPATKGMAGAFDSYGAPIVLLNSGDPDPVVYGGSNRAIGHGEARPELIAGPGDGGVSLTPGRFGVPASHQGFRAASVLTYAGALEAGGLDADSATRRADAVAACASQTLITGFVIEGETATPSRSEDLIAIEPHMIASPVSARDILEGGAELARDAVVVVSDATEFDYARDGEPEAVAVGHAWTIAALDQAADACK
jgi:hypothetical protein